MSLIRTPMKGSQETPFSRTNPVKSRSVQMHNARAVNYQGFTFNVGAGASVQTLQLPGDCFFIAGHFASWDTSTSPGFNIPVTLGINNHNVSNTIDLKALDINAMNTNPRYLPLNRIVSPSSTFTLDFANNTANTIIGLCYVIVYYDSPLEG